MLQHPSPPQPAARGTKPPPSPKHPGILAFLAGNRSKRSAARAAAADSLIAAGDVPRASAFGALARIEAFLQWLSGWLLSSLYPGAPFERKSFGLELLLAFLETWGDAATAAEAGAHPGCDGGDAERQRLQHAFQPFDPALLSTAATTVLLGGVVDGRDKLRAGAARALSLLPSPLPGLDAPAALVPLLVWARQLLLSPRQRESDAGARIVRLVLDDYVLRLGWRVQLWPDVVVEAPESASEAIAEGAALARIGGGGGGAKHATPHPAGAAAALALLQSLLLKAAQQADLAATDLVAACRQGLVHGPLLAVRYACESMPLAAAAAGGGGEELRASVADLMGLLGRVASVALPPLSRQDTNVAAGEVDEEGAGGDGGDAGGEEGGAGADLGPAPQLVNTGCWTSVKEVAATASALAAALSIPSAGGGAAPLLSAAQLEAAGAMQLGLLLALKHNGAVDKTQESFASLCGRLLRSEAPELRALPGGWLERCIQHMCRPGERAALSSAKLQSHPSVPALLFAGLPAKSFAYVFTRCPDANQVSASTTLSAGPPDCRPPSWRSSFPSPPARRGGCCRRGWRGCWRSRRTRRSSRGRGCALAWGWGFACTVVCTPLLLVACSSFS